MNVRSVQEKWLKRCNAIARIAMVMLAFCTACVHDKGVTREVQWWMPTSEGDGGLPAYLKGVVALLNDKSLAGEEWVGSYMTSEEYWSKYRLIYANPSRTIVSYRVERYSYTGGAHGSLFVGIGTIELKTGRRLTLADVIPADKREDALARVREAVVKKVGGTENLSGNVWLTDNFCIAEDGLHFIFNEYQVAAYCVGDVEVVIPAYGEFR